jgi:cutinase
MHVKYESPFPDNIAGLTSKQYPASIPLKESARKGMDDVINRLNKQSKLCPDQDFTLVGYSQGAGVIHGIFQGAGRTYPGQKGTAPVLDPSVLPKIKALVTFGDPGFRGELVFPYPKEFQSRVKINCAHKDPVSS